MNRCIAGLLLLLPGLVVTGCGQNAELASQHSRVIASDNPDAVLAAAVVILRREFGRVQVDREGRMITSAPAQYRTTRDSGTARDLYRGRSTMRRVAQLRVYRRGASTVARLRIDIERQDTARTLSGRPPTGRLSDSPAYTPIERDAATTERQNTVWTKVRRDRRLERELLRELQGQFAGPPVRAEVAAEETTENQAGGPP